MPKSSTEFWQTKFDDNVARDARNEKSLRNMGWTVLVVWECETTCEESLDDIAQKILVSREVR